jgi:hypothetical protein
MLAMGEKNQQSKLTEFDVADVLVMSHVKGFVSKTIATHFETAESTINLIRRGKSWRYLTLGRSDVLIVPSRASAEEAHDRIEQLLDCIKQKALSHPQFLE